jgi:hypothetical protein
VVGDADLVNEGAEQVTHVVHPVGEGEEEVADEVADEVTGGGEWRRRGETERAEEEVAGGGEGGRSRWPTTPRRGEADRAAARCRAAGANGEEGR